MDTSAGNQQWQDVDVAADGSSAIAITGPDGSIWLWSTPATRTPTTRPTPAPTVPAGPGELVPVPGTSGQNWSSIAWDATGTVAIATLADGGVYQSFDGGYSFQPLTGNGVPGNNTWTASASRYVLRSLVDRL